ncbi:MAG: TonB-dependent receptor [Gemmatimonadota bacterium]
MHCHPAVTLLAAIGAFVLSESAAAQQQARPDSTARRDTIAKLATVEVRASASGRGRIRNANAIDSTSLRLEPPGTSALKVIERLPGVNVQSADPFGMYEWSNRVTIRGFQTQQIGQTFDGLPLGDMSYGNFNGLGIGRAVDPQNLSDATVAQGSGALGTASSNNLGGVVQYTSGDAQNRPGVDFRQLFGAADARRTFLRLNSGFHQMGANASYKGFLSFSRTGSDKWKGGGRRFSQPLGDIIGDNSFLGQKSENWQDQVNAKLQAFVGPHQFTAYYDFSDKKESDYADLSLARFNQSGRGWDQYSRWDSAQLGATSSTPDEAYFYSAEGARRDHLGYLRGDFKLGELSRLVITPYIHELRGAGDWHAPSYGAAYSPDPIMFRQSQYENDRKGVLASASSIVGRNKIEGGIWFENNDVTNRRPRWRLADYTSGPAVNFDDMIRLDYDRSGDLKTTNVYLQNTNTFMDDRLRVTYGAKYLYINAKFHSNGNTLAAPLFADDGRPDLSLPTKGGVLPQAGAVYALNDNDQLFGSFAANVNAFPYSPANGVYGVDPSVFTTLKDASPEKAYTYELGVRTKRQVVEASVAAYSIAYHNRLLQIANCPPTATCASSFANVGNVTSRGAEGLVSWSILPSLQWTSSLSYNRATYDDDYQNHGASVATGGKSVVDAPKVLANSDLRYTKAGAFVTFGGHFVDKRYFSYLNDQSVPSYGVFQTGAGYSFARWGAARNLTMQFNIENLFDKSYIATLGSNGFTVSGDTQTLLAGSRRLVYFTIASSF